MDEEGGAEVVARYEDDPDRLMLDGFMLDADREKLAGKPFVVVSPAGRGRVVYFACDPSFRGYWVRVEPAVFEQHDIRSDPLAGDWPLQRSGYFRAVRERLAFSFAISPAKPTNVTVAPWYCRRKLRSTSFATTSKLLPG